jgi:hypothetical protein
MTITFTHKADGSCVMRCDRADGSATWQRRDGEFFALHDMTHYALESVLGLRYGFYGLLADGWNVSDFGHPWPRGPIPAHAMADAMLAEWLAGLLDQERGTGHRMDASGFNLALSGMAATAGHPAPRPVTDRELEAARGLYQETAMTWRGLSDGERMTLSIHDGI